MRIKLGNNVLQCLEHGYELLLNFWGYEHALIKRRLRIPQTLLSQHGRYYSASFWERHCQRFFAWSIWGRVQFSSTLQTSWIQWGLEQTTGSAVLRSLVTLTKAVSVIWWRKRRMSSRKCGKWGWADSEWSQVFSLSALEKLGSS